MPLYGSHLLLMVQATSHADSVNLHVAHSSV